MFTSRHLHQERREIKPSLSVRPIDQVARVRLGFSTTCTVEVLVHLMSTLKRGPHSAKFGLKLETGFINGVDALVANVTDSQDL